MHDGWKQIDATVASVVEYHTKAGPMYSVIFTYKVDGSWLGGTFTTASPYVKDDLVPMLYDPAKPERNSLTQREKLRNWGTWLFLALLLAAVIYLNFSGK